MTDKMLENGARSIANTMGTRNFMDRARACWLAMTSDGEEPQPRQGQASEKLEIAAKLLRRLCTDEDADARAEAKRIYGL